MAQINNNGWLKAILAASTSAAGTIVTIGFFAGQYLTEFKAQGNKLDKVDNKVDNVSARLDTISARQVQNQFNNEFRFQAMENAIERGQTYVRPKNTGSVIQRYVNGKLTYVAVK